MESERATLALKFPNPSRKEELGRESRQKDGFISDIMLDWKPGLVPSVLNKQPSAAGNVVEPG